jgi:uncharacterized membrane protein YkoI
MKRSLTTLAMLIAVAVAAPAMAGSAAPLKGAKLAPMAHVKLAVARATALKARPGKITNQELEKEKGGSGLRYSFDILSGGKTYEIGVDAKSGAVLENAAEGKNPD